MHNEEYGHSETRYITLENPWGLFGQHHFVTFPFIRTLFSGGHTFTYIFFIISGYVLSHKPLQLVHSNDLGSLAKSIGSSLFRRWGRLFLPLFVVTFVWMSSWYIFGIHSTTGKLDPLPSWTAELRRWWDLNNNGECEAYNGHLWTIPVEFWGSVLVYCTILATSSFTHTARLLTAVALCAHRVYLEKSDAPFLVGILLCDVTLLAKEDKLPSVLRRVRPRYQLLWCIPFLLGLYLSAFGHGFAFKLSHFSGYPGSSILGFLVPPNTDFKLWYRFWASALIVISISQIWFLKHVLESRIVQFLGRVSYGLYLIHGPIVWSVGVRMYAAFGLDDRYPELKSWHNIARLPGGPLGLEVRWLVPFALLLALALTIAELFTRFIDEPCIKFVQWCFAFGRPVAEPRTESTLPLLEVEKGLGIQEV
jgi:peptidoglycan/LPS O-acetylase OafA/YrhL